MNDRELMQQALDAYNKFDYSRFPTVKALENTMLSIKARLAQPEPNKKDILRIRQEEWRKAQQISKDYIDDPECCFALGFDACYGAVAQKVEPPAMESGGGFESLPASPKKWVGLTDEEVENIAHDVGYGYINVSSAIEQALREKNT